MVLTILHYKFCSIIATITRSTMMSLKNLSAGLSPLDRYYYDAVQTVYIARADRKSQVRQCLGFCTADFGPHWPINQMNKNQNIA